MAKLAHLQPALFDFLRELKEHNSRPWFKRNQARYERDVRDPVLRFIADLGPRLTRLSPHFVADPRPAGGSMFRIYRDVRFSRDKSPYKTVAAAQFRHARGRDVHAPGFYLHLEPEQVFAGAGLWHPDTRTQRRLRDAIVSDPAGWQKAISGRAFRSLCRLEGGRLKRPPTGYDREHPHVEDLKRKDFVATTPLSEEEACAPDFLDQFIRTCKATAPLMAFLTRALDLPY